MPLFPASKAEAAGYYTWEKFTSKKVTEYRVGIQSISSGSGYRGFTGFESYNFDTSTGLLYTTGQMINMSDAGPAIPHSSGSSSSKSVYNKKADGSITQSNNYQSWCNLDCTAFTQSGEFYSEYKLYSVPVEVDKPVDSMGIVSSTSSNAYPSNKVHTDGYYYVSKGYVNNTPPVFTFSTSGNISIYNDVQLKITGTVADVNNQNVTISMSLGGSTKSTVIAATSSYKNWELTWNAGEIPAGTYTNPVLTANDGLDISSASYSGNIEIKPQVYYYWTKYKVVPSTGWYQTTNDRQQVYYMKYNKSGVRERLDGEYDKLFSMLVDNQIFSNITINNDNITLYDPSSTPYWNYNFSYFFKMNGNYYMLRNTYRSNDTGLELFDVSSNPPKGAGSVIQANVKAAQGTYPDNGIHSDGYWYIKGSTVPNQKPVIAISVFNNQRVTLKPGDDTIKISGAVADLDNDTLLVSATILGVKKEISVSDTSTSKTWELTWRTSEFESSGSEKDVVVTVDDGKGGVAYDTYKDRTITVDKTPLFYWDKYSMVDKLKYVVVGGDSTRDVGGSMWGNTSYTIDNQFGVFVLRGDYASVDTAGVIYNMASTSYDKVWEYRREGGYVYVRLLTLDKTSVKEKGSLAQANILDLDKTYPDNGLHSDGFWYVKKATTNMSPVLSVNSSDTLIGVKDSTIKVKGTVYDADNDNVKIKASLAGITKEITTANTSSSKTWELTWDVSDIPEDIYSNIIITADDGKEGIDIVSYAGSITVDKTPPVITITTAEPSWVKEPIQATITYADSLSGIGSNARQYKVTSTPDVPETWDVSDSNQLNLTLEEDGQWYIHAKSADVVGNETTAVSGPYRLQHVPTPPILKLNSVTSASINLGWTLPTSTYTNGYEYTVTNLTTGKKWTVDYPTDHIIDEDLKAGAEYEYTVKVKNYVGESFSESFKLLTLPKKVEGLQIAFEDYHSDQATISFDAVPSASEYVFTLYTSLQGELEKVSEQTWQAAGEHTLTHLDTGTRYSASLVAKNTSGQSEAVSIGFMSLPAAPGEFKTILITDHSVELGWLSAPTAERYELFRDQATLYEGAELSFLDEKVEAATTYQYQLSAKNESGFGDITELDVLTLPSKVASKVEKITATSVDLSWEAVSGADKYIVLLNGKTVEQASSEQTHVLLKELAPGKDYDIAVVAQNASGQSTPDVLHVKTLADAPSNVTAKEMTETSVILQWDAMVGADKYKVTVSGQQYEVAEPELKLNGLVGDQKYDLTIQAGNVSGYSEESEFTFLTLPSTPEVKINKVDSNAFSVTWNKQQGELQYKVYDEQEKEIATTKELSYTWSGLEAGKIYTFFVSAVNASGGGVKTKVIQQTLPSSWHVDPDASDQPITIGERNEHTVIIHVEPVKGADQYKVVDDNGNVVGIIASPETAAEIGGLESAKKYEGWKIIPINNAGEGEAAPVPTFVTLPSSNFKISVTDAKTSSLTLQVESFLVNEIFVYTMNGKELYRGKEKSFVVNKLDANTSYTFKVWTENSLGDRTEPVSVQGRTLEIPPVSNDSVSHTNTETVSQPDDPDSSNEETSNNGASPLKFTDISTSFARSEILELAERGIVKGISDTQFAPDQKVTRVEFASMLVRALELQEASDVPLSFEDIQRTAWYVPELSAAILSGVAHGFSDKEFRPQDPISREQASKMIANAVYDDSLPEGEIRFRDAKTIAVWAKPEVTALTTEKVINGYPDGSFKPKRDLTRAECAVLIYRSLSFIK